jgi:transcriptional regulator with XRE-family HTH domain
MFIAANLKLLRKRSGKSQEELAQALGLNRSTYSGYENEVAQPSLEMLLSISQFHKVTLDDLIAKDFSKYLDSDWNSMENHWKTGAKGTNLRILTTVVNADNEEEVELIPEKVRAGYVAGYADPEFMRDLPTLKLPFLSKNRKYRAFPISGDSMPPVSHGSYVVGEFVQDWLSLPSNSPCVIVTNNDGIVFKYVFNQLKEAQQFLLVSSNPSYEPYTVSVENILEVWRFVSYISKDIPDVQLDAEGVGASFRNLQKDIQQILIHLSDPNSKA